MMRLSRKISTIWFYLEALLVFYTFISTAIGQEYFNSLAEFILKNSISSKILGSNLMIAFVGMPYKWNLRLIDLSCIAMAFGSLLVMVTYAANVLVNRQQIESSEKFAKLKAMINQQSTSSWISQQFLIGFIFFAWAFFFVDDFIIGTIEISTPANLALNALIASFSPICIFALLAYFVINVVVRLSRIG